MRSTSYQPIAISKSLPPEETYFHMMNCLLYSRMEANFPSNEECFDEDVNVYLANLLTSMVYPDYQATLVSYLMPDDVSLSETIASITNPRIKYEIYKINADHILVSLGIFKNARRVRPAGTALLEPGDACYIGRGTTYYELAQSYARRTFRRNTAVSDVLGKLSRNFERYLGILSLMAGEYLNMVRAMSEGELYHLEHEVSRIGHGGERRALYDQFLDAYSSYRKRKSARARRSLDAAVRRLQLVDPSFHFELKT